MMTRFLCPAPKFKRARRRKRGKFDLSCVRRSISRAKNEPHEDGFCDIGLDVASRRGALE